MTAPASTLVIYGDRIWRAENRCGAKATRLFGVLVHHIGFAAIHRGFLGATSALLQRLYSEWLLRLPGFTLSN